MIPPLTDTFIAKAIQTSGMADAGQSYWLQGRVGDLDIDPDMEMITAQVQGSRRRPYDVTIVFIDSADGHELEVDCSCPVGFGCKHGAAVLYAAQAQLAQAPSRHTSIAKIAPVRPAPLPQALFQWLAEAQTEAMAIRQPAFDVAYVLSPRGLDNGKRTKLPPPDQALPQRLIVAVWLFGSDRQGQARWFQPSAYDLREGRLALGAMDQWLIRRMTSYGGDLDSSGSPKGVAGGDWIDRVIATGRARWRKVDGPMLCRAEEQRAPWQWVTLADGGQKLTLGGVQDDQVLLACAPPIAVDEATGAMHPLICDTDPALAQRLLLMPALPPETVAQMAEHWPMIAGAGVPAPGLSHIEEAGILAPVPVLTFTQEKVDLYRARRYGYANSATQKAEMALARLSFDYDGFNVMPATEAREIIRKGPQGFIRFTRDLDAEHQALMMMAQTELVPLDALDDIKAKPAQNWDFAPHVGAQPIDFAAFLQSDVPHLQALGWRVDYGKKWQLSIAEVGGDDLSFAVTPSGTDWFDITLGARIGEATIDILPVLRALLAAGPEALDLAGESITIPLGRGKLARLPLEPIRPVLATLLELALNEREASGALRLPKNDMAALADLEHATQARIGWQGSDAFRALARALTRIDSHPVAPPSAFLASLRPYQQQGFDWLQALHGAGFGGVLADDMGLGKTVQTLAHIATLQAGGRLDGPVLIVCPTSVLPNWQAEIAQFTPDLTVALWHGHDRHHGQDALAQADIVLTSYPLLLRDHAMLAALSLGVIVFDEAHTLKNPRTAGFKAAKTLTAGQIIALSGTPVENQLTDIWSLTDLVTPGLLGPLDQFRRLIDRPITRDQDEDAKALLRRRLRPFMLRRTKDAVAHDLPHKTEIPEWIDLEKNQSASYEGVRLLMQKRVRDEIARVGLLRSQIVFLDALLKLRQLCCDPRLVSQHAGKNAGSAKLARLLEMLPELLREGRKIILFSQFTSMLDLIKPELDALHISFAEIRGDTQDRQAPVHRFQAGEVPLILVSLKAGGTGLNLTAADTVILYDPWWNPAVEAQAIDRAHRIGQDKPVFVHRLIARDTIEDKILALQGRKRALADMLWDADSAMPAQLTEEDVAFLLG